MIKNNLILELMKVELKKGSIAEKRYVIQGNGKDRGKVFEDELWFNIKLDVSTFDKELIQEQLTTLIHYKRRYRKIGKSEVYCGLIGSSEYNLTNGEVLLSMLKCDYEDLTSFVQEQKTKGK